MKINYRKNAVQLFILSEIQTLYATGLDFFSIWVLFVRLQLLMSN